MNKIKIKASVKKILGTTSVGSMATVKDNQPHSCYMTFYHQDLTLFTATNASVRNKNKVRTKSNYL